MFSCTICDKRYTTQNFLNLHYTVMHNVNSEPKKCKICFHNETKALIYPCGHAQFCLKCANQLKHQCPLCRNKIIDVVEIFD